jgi:hypothetical protein
MILYISKQIPAALLDHARIIASVVGTKCGRSNCKGRSAYIDWIFDSRNSRRDESCPNHPVQHR